ncbi:helix-turn-helix transcriptional regulator [Cellulosimicrobium protaetiae]|uniref:Helix-turn-helix transcriptional regulator n=1 Tax=Cellulosimicrobium protaetiae TaxID=2587808 RepID=A0A6M5UA64_9MICO|nr:helix-turn-helix transcriptional regulator [Cellulosimicrobium protaetiae]
METTVGPWHDRGVTTLPDDQRLRDLARLRSVRDRIDREYAQPLDVAALAAGVHVSAGHLSREFKAAYGESVYAYLMTRRIERAKALLRRGDLSVTDVCFAVGCSSLGTFSTRFTELVGVPPSVYRRRAAESDAAARSSTELRATATAGTGPRAADVVSGRVPAAGQDPGAERLDGIPACVARRVTRPVRNREARSGRPS